MNKGLLFFFLMFWGTLLHAQNQNVVIDGVTFSADRKTLISYPRDKVDKEYVVPEGTEVICEKAFNSLSNIKKITLPLSLKEIGNYAFSYCSSLISITWGNFPEIIGGSIFYETPVEEFYILNENGNCVVIDNVLFSADRKALLRYPPNRKHYIGDDLSILDYATNYIVPEGTEIIDENAFERANMYIVTLPSTLKAIKNAAFWVQAQIPTKSDRSDEDLQFRAMYWVTCKALSPPIMIGHPFAYPCYTELYVPDESYTAYCYAPGWTEFGQVNGERNPASVNNTSIKTTKVWFEDFILNVTSEQRITKVYVYNQIGTLLTEQEAGGNSWFWDMETLHPQGLLLIRVVYDDFTEDIFKRIK